MSNLTGELRKCFIPLCNETENLEEYDGVMLCPLCKVRNKSKDFWHDKKKGEEELLLKQEERRRVLLLKEEERKQKREDERKAYEEKWADFDINCNTCKIDLDITSETCKYCTTRLKRLMKDNYDPKE